jgi:hypothetical protein
MKLYHHLLLFLCLISFSSVVTAQQHSFSSYKVSLYKGHKAKLRLDGNKLATQYRTGIRDTYYSTKDQVEYHGLTGLNFAGHYCFVYLGCGSDCQLSFVVDLKTGIVYPGVDAGRGYQFKPNSKLLIINPPNNGQPSAIFRTEYYAWNESAMKLEKVK